MIIINTKPIVEELNKAVDNAKLMGAAAYEKVAPITISIKNSVVEAYAAAKNYANGLLSTAKSIWHGIKMSYSLGASVAHLGKGALYEAPKMGLNRFHYKDEAAVKAAKEAGSASLSAAGVELVKAYQEAANLLSEAYAATLSTVNGLVHTKDSVYYAGDATVKGVGLAKESAQAAYNMLPAYSRVCEAAAKGKALGNQIVVKASQALEAALDVALPTQVTSPVEIEMSDLRGVKVA